MARQAYPASPVFNVNALWIPLQAAAGDCPKGYCPMPTEGNYICNTKVSAQSRFLSEVFGKVQTLDCTLWCSAQHAHEPGHSPTLSRLPVSPWAWKKHLCTGWQVPTQVHAEWNPLWRHQELPMPLL